MKPFKSTPSPGAVSRQTPAYQTKRRALGLWAAALLMAALLPGQAGNILTNPSFEADGNHGSGVPITGWVANSGGPWYINTDSYAHSGNNYYKVWGSFSGSPNYQAIYQDNNSLPTSTYQADGWMFTLPTDVMWSGDDLDYAWLEVSFRDASNNILALYRSDEFNNTLGSIPYTTGVWYDFPITNVCQTVAPYTVIGSTNVLVAPLGTVKVRFQQTLYQSLYGGGSVYFDDADLNQTGGPVPPQITKQYPGNLLFATNYISFHVTSASSSPISTSNIHLVVNGTDVSSGCTFTGSTPDISVFYNGLASNVWAYTASITVTDAYNFTASATMSFDTIQPAFVWEAEDYDFTNAVTGTGGNYIESPILASEPTPGSYFGVVGVTNVDYARPAGPSGQNAMYRTNDWTGIGIASETARQKFLDAEAVNPAIHDWTVGYINQYDWMNYTRSYPTGTFNIYGRLAGGAGATIVNLDDVTTPGVTNNVGVFTFSGSDWGAYNYVPLVDTNGNLLQVTLGGVKTLRVTLESGGDNMNFFMLKPAIVGLPALTAVTPTNGSMFVSSGAVSFTASSTTTINNSGIHLTVNGADVSSGLVITGSGTSKNVSWPLLQSNQFYTVVIAVTNSGGSGVSRTVQFDTMSTANFYVKIEDFDYNGGEFDMVNNGLYPNGYASENDSILDIDYYHVNGGSYYYRDGLATEPTSDVPLPGYTAGSDYDVGNFNSGDWGNFTRYYPNGKYWVYGRLAGYNLVAYLDEVMGGWGTTNQVIQRLGEWSANPNGWQNWDWVPLMDTNLDAPVVVTISGITNTLRVTSGGNVNANYFMFVPLQGLKTSAVVNGNQVGIQFKTQAGSSYRVFWAPTLTSSTWTLLGSVAGDGTVKTLNDTPSGSQRYYKVTSP